MKRISTLLRATLITSVALLSGALLLGVITMIVASLRTYTMTPADLLPAERTLALFAGADDALLRDYERLFPELALLPQARVRRTVAVLDRKDGGRAVAFFARRPLPAGVFPSGPHWSERDIGPLTVVTSSPDVFALLDEQGGTLRRSPSYQALNRAVAGDVPWVYLQASVLPGPQTLAENILASLITEGATHLGITPRGASGTVIHFFPFASGTEGVLPPLPDNGRVHFSLALADTASQWERFRATRTPAQLLTLEAEVLTLMALTFGPDVSAEYDLLPLVVAPARLTLTTTASGASAFLLQGSAPEAKKTLDLLHDSFRGTLTSARNLTRVFADGAYVFRNVRDDASLLTDESYGVGTALVRATARGTEHGLYSATYGMHFALSSDRGVLEAAVRAGPRAMHAPALAAGIVARNNLRPLAPLLQDENTYSWTLTHRGDLRTLTAIPR